MRWGTQRWGTQKWGGGSGGADTIDDYFEHAPWEVELPESGEIELPFPGGGDPVIISLAIGRRVFYRIEIIDEAGDKLAEVTDFLSGDYEVSLAEPAVLRFRVLGDDPALALLIHPNRVVLRDARGFVLDRFVPRRLSKFRDGDARFVDVECHSLLSLLVRQPVIEYSATATVAEHVAALMSLQVGDYLIETGVIEEPIASTSLTLNMEVGNILGAILELRELLPLDQRGHLYVGIDTALRWVLRTGPPGRKLEIGWNLTGLRYSTNDDDLITRLYMFGEGQDGGARVSLVDAGLANPYIEQNVATYGIVPMVKIDRRILKPETLLARATAIIGEFSTPRVEITVSVLDLARADSDLDLSAWGDYWIGSEYQAIDTQQGIDTTVRVSRIRYDLGDPVPVQMDLANRQRSLSDLLRELDDRVPASTDVNDDGSRYPNIARYYNDTGAFSPDEFRNGDFRRNTADEKIQYRQEDDWRNIGAADVTDDAGLDVTTAEGVAGSSEEAARADHTHQGWPIPREVTALPSLPAAGVDVVKWISTGGGDGDDGIWIGIAGLTEWIPTHLTDLSGVP